MSPRLLFLHSTVSICLSLALAHFPLAHSTLAQAQSGFPSVKSVERQPLLAQVKRVTDALAYLGTPLPPKVTDELKSLTEFKSEAEITRKVQLLLDPYCLLGVTINDKPKPAISLGPARPQLSEQGWKTFLIKVDNQAEDSGRLLFDSPNAKPLPNSPANLVDSRWMQLAVFEGRPLNPELSGLKLEYRILQIYCRDAGTKNGLLEISFSRSGDGGETIRKWRFDKDTDGWFAMNQSKIEAVNGSLQVTSTGRDPYMGSKVSSRRGRMMLRFWGKSNTDGIGQLYWWTKEKPNPDGQRQVVFLVNPDREALYEIPFESKGELAGVRLDPLVKPGKFRIDWIDLCHATRATNWSKQAIRFESQSAAPVTFRILDAYGKPGFATFTIHDEKGQVFPAQSKRLAPDFFFQKQIYRGDKEKIALPPGTYRVTCSRGPETIPEVKTLVVKDKPVEFFYRIKRWIDPALDGWYSGDHHIHAAGCLHYENPTEGVMPEDMIRHIMGEDLKVGCCLTWGPCFDFQKRFFTGKTAEQSVYPYTLRYDVEVSGFGSHRSGHLNLLNLKEQIYPGGESKDHWPTLGLNTLRWAKRQGAVCGPAHSSLGLTRSVGRLSGTEGKDGAFGLPNFEIPAFDGIGANEFIMNVTHQVPGPDGQPMRAVDFISAMNTQRVAEWNIWYHVLNCGFKVAVSGETDFPCVSGERVGLGRVYAKVDGPLTFAKWVKAIAKGRSYVSDGTSHLMDFRVTDSKNATVYAGVDSSEFSVAEKTKLKFASDVAVRLTGNQTVKVELIVNGYPVASKQVAADGKSRQIEFEHEVSKSSWAAIRIFPRAHSNPVFVIVDKKPVRASVDSARWCLASVKQCRKSKMPAYAQAEQNDANKAYDHAEQIFQSILDESNK